jgi:hypothetical protein
MKTFLAVVGGLVIGLLVIAYAIFSGGFVLVKLWAWFISPFGVPTIKFAHALGISTIVGYLSSDRIGWHYIESPSGSKYKIKIDFWTAIIAPWFALLGGFIIHKFM